ncbi:MAG: hypothetical protein KGL02_11845, partial [Acidobacteriota bacterium]|nr:hypothetical protein [Acidobacteriota bacterium]
MTRQALRLRLPRVRTLSHLAAALVAGSLATAAIAPGHDANARSRADRPSAQASSSGESTTTLAGIVRTAAGDPIPGAAVRATRTESNQAW